MLPKVKKSKKIIYFDHAATTYLDLRVQKVMQPYWRKIYGNPSSLYSIGQQAKTAVERARSNIAQILNCQAKEIIFTAGGTESVNLAIFGVIRQFQKDIRQNSSLAMPHIITSVIEHHAVLESFKALQQEGVEVSYISVDHQGFVNQQKLLNAIKPNTILISLIYANNEIGTIQAIPQIARNLAKINRERLQQNLPQIILHTDACQAAGSLNINVKDLAVDMLSLNASKVYGPKQMALLYKRAGLQIKPLIYGGGQESDLRSGTENVPGIVGFAEALSLVQKNKIKENARLRALRNYFISEILKNVKGALLNGPAIQNDSDENPMRLPNNINFSFAGLEGEALMLYLDSYNVAVATGSACTSVGNDPSHVISAIGRSFSEAAGTIRMTLGAINKKSDIDYVMKILPGLASELRRVAPNFQSEEIFRAKSKKMV
jgi:cysteine desulfurase